MLVEVKVVAAEQVAAKVAPFLLECRWLEWPAKLRVYLYHLVTTCNRSVSMFQRRLLWAFFCGFLDKIDSISSLKLSLSYCQNYDGSLSNVLLALLMEHYN